MTAEKFREACHAEPFLPFMIHLADGRKIPVLHQEFVITSASGRIIVVMQPDESMNILDLFLVTDIEFKRPRSAARKRRRTG